MASALSSSPLRDPRQCLTGLAEVIRRLDAELDIHVTHAALPDHEIVDYDEPTGILKVRQTATPEQQVLALVQIWFLVTLGPWAAPAARRQPNLYLVPTQRRRVTPP